MDWAVGLGLGLGLGLGWVGLKGSAIPNKQWMGSLPPPPFPPLAPPTFVLAAATGLLRIVSMCRKKMTLLKKRTRGLQPCQMRGGAGVGPPGWLSWSTAWPGGVSRGNAAELSWLCQVSLLWGMGGDPTPRGGGGGCLVQKRQNCHTGAASLLAAALLHCLIRLHQWGKGKAPATRSVPDLG